MGLRESIAGIQPFAEISRGPMTVVYKGYDPSLNRFVLLKVLKPEYSKDPIIAERFGNEACLLAKVQHPNVVTVIASGIEDESAYLVTEFVEGASLADILLRSIPPPELAAFIIGRIAAGLGAAHDAGVLHRDLKPDNVLISLEGEVKLTDFGLAVTSESVTAEQPSIAGTLGFLAPEIVNGSSPTRASDLFSCGATLFEMLTGQPAFPGDNDGDVIDAVLNRNPMHRVDEFANAPAGLLVLCGKLLRKAPEERIATCPELHQAATQWLVGFGLDVTAEDLARFVADHEHYQSAVSIPRAVPASRSADRPGSKPVARPNPIHASPDRRLNVASRWFTIAAAVVVLGAAGAVVFSQTDYFGSPVEPGRPEISSTLGVNNDTGREPVLSDRMDDSIDSGASEDDESPSSGLAGDRSAQIHSTPDQRADTENSAGGEDPVEAPLISAAFDSTPAKTSTTPTVGGGSEGRSVGNIGQEADTDSDTDTPLQVDNIQPEVAPSRGTLSVITVPWASISVNGNSYDGSPTDTLTLDAGVHDLILRNPEFPDVVQTVEVFPGVHRDVRVSLWASIARLSLTVVPWAIVEIDGAVLDTIPPQSKPFILSPGTHRLRLTHPDLGQITRDILLAAGEKKHLAYNLREASAQ